MARQPQRRCGHPRGLRDHRSPLCRLRVWRMQRHRDPEGLHREAQPVDHRRWRRCLRHRFRRSRPRPRFRQECQHPCPRHRGLLQHRRPGIEGYPHWRHRQVRRVRQAHPQERPRSDRHHLRLRLRRTGSDGRRPGPDPQGNPWGWGLRRSLDHHRLQPLYQPWPPLRNGQIPGRGAKSCGMRLLAPLALQPRTRRRR